MDIKSFFCERVFVRSKRKRKNQLKEKKKMRPFEKQKSAKFFLSHTFSFQPLIRSRLGSINHAASAARDLPGEFLSASCSLPSRQLPGGKGPGADRKRRSLSFLMPSSCFLDRRRSPKKKKTNLSSTHKKHTKTKSTGAKARRLWRCGASIVQEEER